MAFPDPTPSDHAPGLKQRAERVLAAALDYAGARWQLFNVEAKLAAGHIVRVVVAALAAALFLAIAYVAAWGALITWIAGRWTEGNLTYPLLGTAVFHLLAAGVVGLWLAKRAGSQQFFVATRQEFQEDKLWLTRNQTSRF